MSAPNLRVLVLAGGLGPEREVSLRSGRRVVAALAEAGEFDVTVADLDSDLLATVAAIEPQVAFPVLHGGRGEDGSTRDLLDALGVPYVGAVAGACRLAHAKPTAKSLLAAAGVATPTSLAFPQSLFADLGAAALVDRVVGHVGLPLVVKPARGGSALGCTVVRTPDDMPAALSACFAYDSTALVERFVEGTEIAVSVIDTGTGPRTLPAVEIVPVDGLYDYEARYNAGATELFAPARLAPTALAAAEASALTAHVRLGLRDLSRTDLIVDADGTPWFLEVNVSPGMTETSLLPLAAKAHGLDLVELYGDLVRLAAARG